ncbi:UPF0739 protein C1orf74 homolog [Saccoglossus kowalevskii]|uniref:UPF0739 protein C1orf74 homolog n=1 Tax=Saccoglossus kowalevskii TaxID=10224 RepID=A0ABM0M8P8_SACKO|nr:PREDICTED: UPF0739 protein C1orf74 homolog [Saccoglossus kowalevskii]
MAAPCDLNVLEWRKHIKQKLPKSCLKKTMDILSNIVSVDRGIKPSFLFDFASVDVKQMQQFINGTFKSGLTGQLSCLSLVDDVFIYNRASIVAHLRKIVERTSNFLVDVSNTLPEPQIASCQCHRQVLDHTLQLQRAFSLESASPAPLELKPGDRWNISTVFGILLGYPVIYWYNTEEVRDVSNCLSMVLLTTYRAYVNCNPTTNTDTVGQLIYSFSVPAKLIPRFQREIDDWLKRIQGLCNSSMHCLLDKSSACHSSITL